MGSIVAQLFGQGNRWLPFFALKSRVSHTWSEQSPCVVQSQPGRPTNAAGPFREAIVFVVGGGNYLEAESLAAWAARSQPPKSIVYGTTAMLTGEQFVQQLSVLGKQST